ncbi:MAG: DUF3050 domain-containing protein [bacterium]|nr:DUF3050 domain-containing protein [bacterium]
MSDTTSRIEQLLAPTLEGLVHHPIHAALDSLPRLRAFMPVHVFAVWDFMSLVKRLQNELTGVALPWLPPRDPELARFINEIVLDEESDVGPDGRPASHFDLYIQAMSEVGASSREIRAFLEQLRSGVAVPEALATCRIDPAIREFVQSTLAIAQDGSRLEVAASFLFGREDLIPTMFRALLAAGSAGETRNATGFRFYLERHIELDGEQHSHLARRLVDAFDDGTPAAIELAAQAAHRAITARRKLWDHALAQVTAAAPAPTASLTP